MGSNQIDRKRKANSYERKPGNKATRKRLLIVCEGSKTEPHYFRDMRQDLRLKTADVKICGKECGSDPVSVYKYALKESDDDDVGYDAVFCVFDTDSHKNLDQALEMIERANSFVAIVSSPCFEFWLLLHYVNHVKAFRATATKSIGGVVESALRKHDKAYAKGGSGTWVRYKPLLASAIANSKALHKAALATGNRNPSTEMHIVVEEMMALKA